MSTIYIITSGEYSDYRVHAGFTDKAKAEACMELLGKGYFEVEERPLDPNVDALRGGMKVYEVRVTDGNWSAERAESTAFFDLHHVVENKDMGRVNGHWVNVVAADSKQALKAGMERIREFRALAGVTRHNQEQEEKALRDKQLTLQEKYEREQRIDKAKKAAEADFIFRNQGRIDAIMRENAEKRAALDKEMGKELQRELKRIEDEF